MLNELRYNINDFNNIDEDDVIIVFRGKVYPIYMNDNSEENISYIISIIKEICKVYDGMSDIFFYDDGTLRNTYTEQPYRLMNAFNNFDGLPKLLYGYVTEHDGRYALEFNNSMYDVINSQEFEQLFKTEIVKQFAYFIFNNKVYTFDDIFYQEFDNKKNKNTNIAPILYHGTTSNYIYDIMLKGLRQVKENSKFNVENTGYVYLTSIYESAYNYAQMYTAAKGGEECVVVVDSNKINKNNIVLDYDFAAEYSTDIENSPYKGKIKPRGVYYKGDVASNKSEYGTKFAKIGYKGIIMPSAIKGVYMYQDGRRNFYSKEQILYIYRPLEESVLNEWKPSNYDSLPNMIKLYHGTDIYAMNDIVEDGIISANRGLQHGETSGINWFSTKLTGNFGTGTYFSIEVPKSDFENYTFNFMNDGEVTSHISEIPIDKYNMRIEKLNGIPLRKFIETYNECNGDIWEMQDRTIGWDKEGTFQLTNPSYRYIIEHEFGEDATKEYYEYMNESKKNKKFGVEQGIMMNAAMGDMSMVGCMEENNQLNEVEADDISLKSFEPQDELNPRFWINNKINSRVRLKLLDLADEFYDSLNITWVKPKDIVLTGSIANYNWSKYSDVDVHILVDYKEVWDKTDFVKDYFDSKKQLWSDEHDGLKIYGLPVELYVEDANVKNPNSGIYSLNKNKWIVEPNDFQDAEINEEYIKNVSAKLMTQIDDIDEKLKTEKDSHKLETLSTKMKKLFDKLVKQRKESLEKHGEMGTYNIIWKVLRRSGYLDKIWDIINTVYNKINSIK